MWKLRHDMDNPKAGSDVAVIGDIVRAPGSMCDDDVAHDNAARRGVPRSQFIDTDERPQLETQLIPHRAADPGHDPPSYVMLHVTLNMFKLFPLDSVSWSAINSSPAFPLCSDIFRSLSNLLLKFRQPASHDRYDNSSSQAHQGDLTITNSARDISFMDATNSVSVPINSAHHPVTINYINAITGDGYFGAISGGNVGGRNNDNSSSPPAGMSINPPNPLTVLRSPTGASTKGSPPERITTDTTSRQSNTADSLIQEAIPEPALSTGKACTRSLVSFAIFVAHIICRNISW
ncbi:hypothetical protein EYR36_001878 [Pleurotus pulmonarius]|nr:hypothetical protein EYR36_001878 [Pleurotus pulmonarius]KAF4588367.1 hypothetical protein EYR38_010335 [Pleurotus pulmonarius]